VGEPRGLQTEEEEEEREGGVCTYFTTARRQNYAAWRPLMHPSVRVETSLWSFAVSSTPSSVGASSPSSIHPLLFLPPSHTHKHTHTHLSSSSLSPSSSAYYPLSLYPMYVCKSTILSLSLSLFLSRALSPPLSLVVALSPCRSFALSLFVSLGILVA